MSTHVNRDVNPAPILGENFNWKYCQADKTSNHTISQTVENDCINWMSNLQNKKKWRWILIMLLEDLHLSPYVLLRVFKQTDLPLFHDIEHKEKQLKMVLQGNHRILSKL